MTKGKERFRKFISDFYLVMFQSRAIMYALYTTLLVAMISALVATVIGTVTALAINHMKPVSKNIFMGISNIPMLNADIVTGISLMLAFIALGSPLALRPCSFPISPLTFLMLS